MKNQFWEFVAFHGIWHVRHSHTKYDIGPLWHKEWLLACIGVTLLVQHVGFGLLGMTQGVRNFQKLVHIFQNFRLLWSFKHVEAWVKNRTLSNGLVCLWHGTECIMAFSSEEWQYCKSHPTYKMTLCSNGLGSSSSVSRTQINILLTYHFIGKCSCRLDLSCCCCLLQLLLPAVCKLVWRHLKCIKCKVIYCQSACF